MPVSLSVGSPYRPCACKAMPIHFEIPGYFHPVAILRLRRLFERSQWFDDDQMAEYQGSCLRRVVEAAYRHVPYYRQILERHRLRPSDIQNVDDLKKLPVLSKQTVRENCRELVAADAARYHPKANWTSGTSGEPVGILHDRFSRILEFVYYWRHWNWAGYRLGDPFAQITSESFGGQEQSGRVARYQPLLRRLLLNRDAFVPRNVDRFARAIRRHRPGYLKSVSLPLYYFALLFKEHGIDDISFRAVFSTGETLFPEFRRLIESVFHCKVFDSYGLIEQAAAVAECPEGGYHINSDYAVMESGERQLDSDSGTGILPVIGTTLYNMSMPLIRYEVGDLVEPLPPDTRCPCGRTLPLVKAIHGRIEDAVVTPDGRYVTTLYFITGLVPHVSRFQFVQEDEKTLVANIVPAHGFDSTHEEQLIEGMRRKVGPEMVLRVNRVSPGDFIEGPRGKFRLIVSRVKRAMSPPTPIQGTAERESTSCNGDRSRGAAV